MAEILHSDINGKPNRYPVILTAGFRFYFLFAGVFSVFAMAFWWLWLAVHAVNGAFVSLPMGMAPHLWHAHEMVFGYAAAVIAGFFVTAVPNWTGTEEPKARFVALSGMVWLIGRLAVWFSVALDPVLVAVADLAFIPILASALLGRLSQKTQLRNAIFLLLLTALFAGNLMMHLEWIGWIDAGASTGVRLGIFTTAAMITIIGGRVVPSFTRNALNRKAQHGPLPRQVPALDKAGILLAVLAAMGSLPFVPEMVFGALCVAAGAVNFLRLAGWRGLDTTDSPILWVLHAAYLLLAAGYMVYGFGLLSGAISETSALHLLAVGAIGCMTLAMMTRASLGHSGRKLKVPGSITAAYLSVIAAALVRTFGTLTFDYFQVMLVSGALWLLAFVLYVWVFFPILTTARPKR